MPFVENDGARIHYEVEESGEVQVIHQWVHLQH